MVAKPSVDQGELRLGLDYEWVCCGPVLCLILSTGCDGWGEGRPSLGTLGFLARSLRASSAPRGGPV